MSRTVRHDPETLAHRQDGRELVAAAGGNEGAARLCRRVKRPQAFSDYTLPNSDIFMPIDVERDLLRVTRDMPGWPFRLKRQAAELGLALVSLPEGDPGAGNWHHAIAALTKEFALLSGGLNLALADGSVSADEIEERDLIGEADALIGIVVNLRALFERVLEAGR